MKEKLEDNQYIRIEIHDMRNPYFFYHNEVEVSFLDSSGVCYMKTSSVRV